MGNPPFTTADEAAFSVTDEEPARDSAGRGGPVEDGLPWSALHGFGVTRKEPVSEGGIPLRHFTDRVKRQLSIYFLTQAPASPVPAAAPKGPRNRNRFLELFSSTVLTH